MPLIGDRDPRRLPLLAVKVSVGKAVEKGALHYLTYEWKKGWSEWLRESIESFPSVLEHITMTFLIEGISRVTSHQLVRHRLASYTQESQRYSEARILRSVGAENLEEAFEKWSRVLGEANLKVVERTCVLPFEDSWRTCASSILEYITCRLNGYKMEDCRYVLPQAMRTSLLMTTNLREYLHVIKLRSDKRAQWEIRGIAIAMKELIETVVPDLNLEGNISKEAEIE